MAQTAVDLFTSPMARKKRVLDKYEPNSYRVISEQAEGIIQERSTGPQRKLPPIQPLPEVNILGQGFSENRSKVDYRCNRPNPRNVNFLRHDVRLLNEPVCDVYTKETSQEQSRWWPHRSSKEPHAPAPHTLDTTVRMDFQYKGDQVKGNTRHSSNPSLKPALGSVPVNFLRKPDGKQRLWKEGLSYEHKYDCRADPQYPSRGKRHGAFVWDELPPHEADKMLHYYGCVADKSEQTKLTEDQLNQSVTVIKPAEEAPKPVETSEGGKCAQAGSPVGL